MPAVVHTGRSACVGSVVGVKRPIKPSEIRKGDLVRFESGLNEYASEWRAEGALLQRRASGTYFLLDRPEPAVELPTEPTLGWVAFEDGYHWCGLVSDIEPGDREFEGRRLDTGYYSERWHATKVTAFTPATAVPTAALDELRRRAQVYGDGSPTSDFLAAVDKANA